MWQNFQSYLLPPSSGWLLFVPNYQTTRRYVSEDRTFRQLQVQWRVQAPACCNTTAPASPSSCQIPHCPKLSLGHYFLSYKIEIELLLRNRVWFFSSLLSGLMNSSYGVCQEGWNCLHLSCCLPSRLFTSPSSLNPSLQITTYIECWQKTLLVEKISVRGFHRKLLVFTS